MPQLRLVVLALQDRLAYGPRFEDALAGLFGSAASTLGGPLPSTVSGLASAEPQVPDVPAIPATGASELDRLIAEAGQNFREYQRLTAEGRLAEAGQRLEALKSSLERLAETRE
jgi:uncharacterized membrane protein (UPF0182 family)